MTQYVTAYFAVLVATLGIDAVWLTLMQKRFYRPQLGQLLADQFSLTPAVLFYVVYAVGVLIFAVLPALKSGSWATAALYGAAFGFCAYATYDLTNQATLKDWPLLLTVVDLGWGTVLTALSATIGYLVASRVG